MKVIVCLKEVVDTALSLEPGLRNMVIFREGLPLRLNPNDAAALTLALNLKASSEIEITLISIGPERVESYLRNGLAMGADKALRIWAEDYTDQSPFQKAKLLFRAASLFGSDLVFTGACSPDTGSAQVGPMIAGWLGVPCTVDVLDIELDEKENSVILTRSLGRGRREKVKSTLPSVIAVKGEGKLPCASIDKLIASKSSEVMVLSPNDLGISARDFQYRPTRIDSLVCPRPRPRKVPPIESSLPAFERIRQILEGGISKRRGLRLEGTSEELAERLFELLKKEGVIKPRAD